jgi:galactokinase
VFDPPLQAGFLLSFPPMKSALAEKFSLTFGRPPEIIAYAPGRIEFVGNHTDYNGGTVLGAAINRGVWVGVARREDGLRRFASDQREGIVSQRADNIAKVAGTANWVNYPLGVIAALPVFNLQAPGGFDYFALSNLPTGAGLSSSAAIELASALCFLELTKQKPSRETLVKIGKHAENNFVGVPCGILDQGVSGFGSKNHLVFIDCRGPHFDTVPVPAGAHFWIFNTHTKHALVDGLYAARHRECMEAARTLGVSALVEVTPAALAANEAKLSPLAAKRAHHVVEEIARVGAAVAALRVGDLVAVGKLLTASHRSSQNLFENSTPELDFLVDTLIANPKVYGARLTGGGFGGAVMALTAPHFGKIDADAVVAAYAKKFNAAPAVLDTQTGDGATLLS